MQQYEAAKTIVGILGMKLRDLVSLWSFYLGPVLTLPIFLALALMPYGYSWKDARNEARFLLVLSGVVLGAEALPRVYNPHYSAPLAAGFIALVLIAMRRVLPWRWHGKPSGIFVARAVPSICVFLLVLRLSPGIFKWPPVSTWPNLAKTPPTWCSLSLQNVNRAMILRKLRHDPGRQLVFVHYGPHHDVNRYEWVYNRADLNTAKVIWARDMGPAEDLKLTRFYKNRHAWWVYPDDNPPRLVPYP